MKSKKIRNDVRNVAIIAHVDHGKTTLVDAMLKQTGEFHPDKEGAQDCILDSNDLERERGITILAKATSIPYKGHTINIIDTPGHADFGSEVERILRMVDGVLLLVDAFDGPMPQTRFVLKKSLELLLKPIVVINKVDRAGSDPHRALDKTFALFVELGATDQQLDFPHLYAVGRDGWASKELDVKSTNLTPLLDTILSHVPGPTFEVHRPFQMLITILKHDNFVGRVSIGRIFSGAVKRNEPVTLIKKDGRRIPTKIVKIMRYHGLAESEIETAQAGDIVAVAGLEEANVGDTVASGEKPVPLPALVVDEPTLSMDFSVNDSPFAGLDGRLLTTRQVRDRLFHEQEINVGLRVEEIETGQFRVYGRGELHLSVLVETMRREGFELSLSKPHVLDKLMGGHLCEPAEFLIVDVDQTYQGPTLELLGARGAQMKNMQLQGNRVYLEYIITTRAMMGFKSDLLTITRGTGLMHYSFHGYIPKRGEERRRNVGVLIAQEKGRATAYALDNLQNRGTLFVGPDAPIYGGMIVGESARENSMIVNPCKKKALTNMRAAGSDDNVILTPPKVLSLEQAIEFIEPDEWVEVTPKNIRLRKKILDPIARKRSEKVF